MKRLGADPPSRSLKQKRMEEGAAAADAGSLGGVAEIRRVVARGDAGSPLELRGL